MRSNSGDFIKKRIKEEILKKRLMQSEEEVMGKSERIASKLSISPEFSYSRMILFYVSTKMEVNTHRIIAEALRSGKQVIVPVVNRERVELELSEIKDLGELETGAYGILEPKKEFIRSVEPELIQLAIVPGIAFDLKGNRIGYGFGYYDKLLVKLKCPKIALAFNFQVLPEIKEEKHDIKIDKIITETDVMNIK